MYESWMRSVCRNAEDDLLVLRHCRRCGDLVSCCPDPACRGAYHHEGETEQCAEDLAAADIVCVPLSAEQIVKYQAAEHQRRLQFWGNDPFYEGA